MLYNFTNTISDCNPGIPNPSPFLSISNPENGITDLQIS